MASININTSTVHLIGLNEDNNTQSWSLETFFRKHISIKSQIVKQFLAEVLGTFILIVFCISPIAQYKFSKKDDLYGTSSLTINISGGFGLVIGIIIVGKISGAHLSPAISFSMLLTRQMGLKNFFVYCLGQFIGAFLGAAFVCAIYYDAIKNFDDFGLDSASIFATYPNKNISNFGCFVDQVFSTSLLVISVLAITDKKNLNLSLEMAAIAVGFTIICISSSFAYNCGAALNPARDFSPRLFTLIAGFGEQTFTAGNYFFWIPIVGPMVGSFLGSSIYIMFISSHWELS